MKMTVETGFGYFRETDTGRIVSKACLPVGQHEIRPGYEYHEVPDMAALDEIEVWTDPEETRQAADAAKIAAKLEAIAIDALKKDGVVFESDRYKGK